MPRVYFGFDAQSRPGEHIFLSYSRGDAGRIRGIASELHGMGLPIWYDNGLIPGNLWKKEILREVRQSRITLFFLTKDLFRRDRTFMIEEYQFAKDHSKPRVCIWLDDIGNMDCTSLDDEMYLWWSELSKLQSVEVFHLKTDAEKAKEIFDGICRRDNGFRKYAVSAPKSQPQPASARETKPKQAQPAQPQYSAPMYGMPASQRQSAPQPVTTNKPISKPASVRRTPFIITVAVVLVVAIVGGIWGASALSGNSTSSVKSLSELDSISKGDHFTFGNYPQGENGEEEPIEWRVLAVDGDKALVISEKLLDCVEYNEEYTNVTWETCTLRSWMNHDFLYAAFSNGEQAKIATVTNQNPDNPEYGTEGGNATQDKIFALSIDEVYQCFSNDDNCMAAPTGYTKKRGAWTNDNYSLPSGEKTGWWWLRSPGSYSDGAAYVSIDGGVHRYGDDVNLDRSGVRPAFWLNL